MRNTFDRSAIIAQLPDEVKDELILQLWENYDYNEDWNEELPLQLLEDAGLPVGDPTEGEHDG